MDVIDKLEEMIQRIVREELNENRISMTDDSFHNVKVEIDKIKASIMTIGIELDKNRMDRKVSKSFKNKLKMARNVVDVLYTQLLRYKTDSDSQLKK